jgi:hypothetical protein
LYYEVGLSPSISFRVARQLWSLTCPSVHSSQTPIKPDPRHVLCASCVPNSGQEVFLWPGKLGSLLRAGQSTWLVRVYLGRDPLTGTRTYHNQTIHGPFHEAQRFLNLTLQQRDNGRVTRAAVLSLNQLLDQWPDCRVLRPIGY